MLNKNINRINIIDSLISVHSISINFSEFVIIIVITIYAPPEVDELEWR